MIGLGCYFAFFNKVAYRTSSNTISYLGGSYKMVYVDGGTFNMGSDDPDAADDEKPVHSVTLGSYYIGQTEVTQGLWKAVMGNKPTSWDGDNIPVRNVSWDDCQSFISKLNSITGKTFRMPTEAEWEFATRGGNKSHGYKYSGSNNIEDVAWYSRDVGLGEKKSENKPHPVALKRANELGLYDMSGNVWEWCSGFMGKYNSNAQTDPEGIKGHYLHAFRGGCWDDDAMDCRSSNRECVAMLRGGRLGLRLVLAP